MELREIIRKNINEALGVPENIYETAIQLYDIIINKVEGLNVNSEGEYGFGVRGEFRIADYKFDSVEVTFSIEYKDKLDNPEIIGMSVNNESRKTDDFRLKNVKSKTLELEIKFLVSKSYDFNGFMDFLKSNRNMIIASFSHELKHFYVSNKKIYDNAQERALYDAVSRKGFGVWPIDKFLHDIYYTTVNESLVRPSEVSAAIRNNDISQKDFLEFLKDNDTYLNLKRISQFTYEGLRKELEEDIERVTQFLNRIDINTDNMTDKEKIDEILRLVMINVGNWTIKNYSETLTTSFLEQLVGFEGEKQKVFDKFVRRYQKFNTTEEFFRFYEKLFHFVGKNMIKKISKLYAITKKS